MPQGVIGRITEHTYAQSFVCSVSAGGTSLWVGPMLSTRARWWAEAPVAPAVTEPRACGEGSCEASAR